MISIWNITGEYRDILYFIDAISTKCRTCAPCMDQCILAGLNIVNCLANQSLNWIYQTTFWTASNLLIFWKPHSSHDIKKKPAETSHHHTVIAFKKKKKRNKRKKQHINRERRFRNQHRIDIVG